MAEWLRSLHPLLQALLGGGFTWGVTALGATSALVGRALNRQLGTRR